MNQDLNDLRHIILHNPVVVKVCATLMIFLWVIRVPAVMFFLIAAVAHGL